MHRGYIKVYRKCTDNPLYFAEPFTKWQAWIDLLVLANYKERYIAVRGIPILVKRGQVLVGENFLAERWKWSRGKVRRFLEFLEKKVHQIEQQKNNVTTVITIINYHEYQSNDTPKGSADGTTDGQQTDIPNKVKKVKNSIFIPPTIEEVTEYCKQRNNNIDPEAFIAHYTANGWVQGNSNKKIKDWKACVVTWEKNRKPGEQRTGKGGMQINSDDLFRDSKDAEIEKLKEQETNAD